MRNDIDYEYQAQSGDWGKIKGEWYCVPPLYMEPPNTLPFIYLERGAHPPWVITEEPDGTITVDPPFTLGDQAVKLIVKLSKGYWRDP